MYLKEEIEEYYSQIKQPLIRMEFSDEHRYDFDDQIEVWSCKTLFSGESSVINFKNIIYRRTDSLIENIEHSIIKPTKSTSTILLFFKERISWWLNRIHKSEMSYSWGFSENFKDNHQTFNTSELIYHADEIIEKINSNYGSSKRDKIPNRIVRVRISVFYKILIIEIERLSRIIDIAIEELNINKAISQKPDDIKRFKLVNPLTQELAMTNVLSKLKDSQLVDKSCRAPDFKRVFNGKEINNKVNWIGSPNSLGYFMNQLMEIEIIQRISHGKYQSITHCFILKGRELDPKTLSEAGEPKKEEKGKIKVILEELDIESDFMSDLKNQESI